MFLATVACGVRTRMVYCSAGCSASVASGHQCKPTSNLSSGFFTLVRWLVAFSFSLSDGVGARPLHSQCVLVSCSMQMKVERPEESCCRRPCLADTPPPPEHGSASLTLTCALVLCVTCF